MSGAPHRSRRGRPGGRIAIAPWLAVALSLALLAPAAWADDDGPDAEARARAQSLLDRGDEHLRRGNALRERGRTERATAEYERALRAYRAAFDAVPTTMIYYPIARAEEKLGRYVDAHGHYQIILDEVEDLPDTRRAEIEHRQETVRDRIAGVAVQVQPGGARVSIDGEDVGRAPFDEPLFVDPGEHGIELSADGHRSRRFSIEVAEGGMVQLVVTLEPTDERVDSDGAELAAAGEIESAESSPPSPMPLVAGVSLTAGLGLAATVTGLAAVSRHGTFSDESRPADERQSARDAGQVLSVATDVLLIATAAAAGYTAYYYYAVYRSGDEPELTGDDRAASSSLWLAPYADEEGGGFALGGRF